MCPLIPLILTVASIHGDGRASHDIPAPDIVESVVDVAVSVAEAHCRMEISPEWQGRLTGLLNAPFQRPTSAWWWAKWGLTAASGGWVIPVPEAQPPRELVFREVAFRNPWPLFCDVATDGNALDLTYERSSNNDLVPRWTRTLSNAAWAVENAAAGREINWPTFGFHGFPTPLYSDDMLWAVEAGLVRCLIRPHAAQAIRLLLMSTLYRQCPRSNPESH